MKYLIALALLLLPACGFTPLYGAGGLTNHSEIPPILNQIQIGSIPDRDGQSLRNALIDQFYGGGTPTNPHYKLTIAPLSQSTSDLDVTIDDEATRRQLRVSTVMTLTRIDDPTTPILTRPLYSLVSYNVLQSQFTTRVTQQNARDNAITDLARQIEQAIVVALRTQPSP